MRCTRVPAVAALAWLLVACSSGDSAGPAPDGAVDDAGAGSADGAGQDAHEASPGPDAAAGSDAPVDGVSAGEAAADAEPGEGGEAGDAGYDCTEFHVGGHCIPVTSCAALGNHTSYSGACPGAADIQCCVDTHNEPLPAGWTLMQDAQVTSAMTSWAVAILNDPTTYPMYATATMTFGAQLVMARVEWHPPDFQNSVVHRGVTLYVPTD